jgi:hypothetical protein
VHSARDRRGLVFQGDANGKLNAYAAETGRKLASFDLGS